MASSKDGITQRSDHADGAAIVVGTVYTLLSIHPTPPPFLTRDLFHSFDGFDEAT